MPPPPASISCKDTPANDTDFCPHNVNNCLQHLCQSYETCVDGINQYSCVFTPAERSQEAPTCPATGGVPVSNVIRVMPLGDSITYVSGSYRGYLHTLLKNNGYVADFVGTLHDNAEGGTDPDHEGHNGGTIGPSPTGSQWGDNATTGKNSLYDQVPAFMAQHPHVILLLVGYNDYFNYTGATGYNPNTQSGERYKNLLARIFAADPNVVVFASSLIPSSPGRTPSQGTAGLNTAIKDIVTDYKNAGKRIYFVDMATAAGINPSRDLYDGVHPNSSGGQKMAQLWYTHLRAVLPTEPNTATGSCTSNIPFPSTLNATSTNIPLLPMPEASIQRPGNTEITALSKIIVRQQNLVDAAMVLSENMKPLLQCHMRIVYNSQTCTQPGDIVLNTDPSLAPGTYKIHVDRHIELTASDVATLNLNTSVITQLSMTHGLQTRTVLIPKISAQDTPDFAYRSTMVDLARQYHSIDNLKRLIRLSHFYRINYLHLHLTDDQGFMFPSDVLPNASATQLAPGAPRNYTKNELKDLVYYAYQRGVVLVPEIDTPAHGAAMIRAYPEFWICSPSFTANNCHYHHASINFAKASVREKIKALFNEVADVFYTSPYIHAGGDEADLARAHEDQDFIALSNTDPLFKTGTNINIGSMFNWFLNEINNTVSAKGKTMIVWEGFDATTSTTRHTVAKNVIVMPFDNHRSGPYYIQNGHKVINSSWTPLYVIGDRRPSYKRIYEWNIQKFGYYNTHQDSAYYVNATNTQEASILGAEMCSWETPESDEFQAFHWRIASMSERINNKNYSNFSSFQQRRKDTYAIFNTLEASNNVVFELFGTTEDGDGFYSREAAVRMNTSIPNAEIRYTTNNTEPNANSTLYTSTRHFNQSQGMGLLRIRAAAFDKTTKEKKSPTQTAWLQYRPNTLAFRPSVSSPSSNRFDILFNNHEGEWGESVYQYTSPSVNSSIETDLHQNTLVDSIRIFAATSQTPRFVLEGKRENGTWVTLSDQSANNTSSTSPSTALVFSFDPQPVVASKITFKNTSSYREIMLMAANTVPTETGVAYSSFNGLNHSRRVWLGRNIAYFTDSNSTSQPSENSVFSVLNTLDRAYDFYKEATGYIPAQAKIHKNRSTIAEITNTCGAACGYVGATGIEITPYFSNVLFQEGTPNISNHAYNEVLFYEFGRNFYGFTPKIQTNPARLINTAEAFAVLMRKWSMEASGAEPSAVEKSWHKSAQAEALKYSREAESNWENTIQRGGDRAVQIYVGMWSLMGDAFGDSFKRNFWKEVLQRPNVNNSASVPYREALDNMYIGACKASKRNLEDMFLHTFKWPISDNARNNMAALYGTP